MLRVVARAILALFPPFKFYRSIEDFSSHTAPIIPIRWRRPEVVLSLTIDVKAYEKGRNPFLLPSRLISTGKSTSLPSFYL
jgi:hypothetical protein